VQHHVVGRREGDLVGAAEPEPPGLPDPGDHLRCAAGVDGLGPLAQQPEHDGRAASVPVPGRAQRPEQLGPDPRDAGQQALLGEAGDEPRRGPHRADGVRAGRADPDREQVEDADRHGHRVQLPG